eukprot:m.359611 g.359611  ORF g.359611 m.359611 type:complete len:58 (+) comp18646_c0_seq1:2848-3021(+)
MNGPLTIYSAKQRWDCVFATTWVCGRTHYINAVASPASVLQHNVVSAKRAMSSFTTA